MIICADDFGFTEDINQAILDLAGRGRISAVSCMVGGVAFSPEAIEALRQHAGHLDIGLHFCLNELAPLSESSEIGSLLDEQQKFFTFFTLTRRCYLKQIAVAEVVRELALQYERFCTAFGNTPDFIDGHLHIQQLPGIRDVFLDFIEALPMPQKPYVRNSRVSLYANLSQGVSVAKTFFIAIPGASMEQALKKRTIRTNNGFAGIYNYAAYEKFPFFLQKFTQRLTQPNGLMMTHPGQVESWRRMEYQTLRDATDLPSPVRYSEV